MLNFRHHHSENEINCWIINILMLISTQWRVCSGWVTYIIKIGFDQMQNLLVHFVVFMLLQLLQQIQCTNTFEYLWINQRKNTLKSQFLNISTYFQSMNVKLMSITVENFSKKPRLSANANKFFKPDRMTRTQRASFDPMSSQNGFRMPTCSMR